MDNKVLKEDSRKEVVKILYRAAFKFFQIFSHPTSSITFKEVHLTEKLRVDILNIAIDDKVVIIELKTCRDDFEKDNKWKKYLDYCNRFFFFCPFDVIKPEELPDNIGLVYVDLKNKENPFFKIIKKPKDLKSFKISNAWFKHLYKKLAFRKFAYLNGEFISLKTDPFFQ